MIRTTGKNAKQVDGKNFFADGTTTTDGTEANAQFLNAVQEELAGVVEQSGKTLDANNNNQLAELFPKARYKLFINSGMDLNSSHFEGAKKVFVRIYAGASQKGYLTRNEGGSIFISGIFQSNLGRYRQGIIDFNIFNSFSFVLGSAISPIQIVRMSGNNANLTLKKGGDSTLSLKGKSSENDRNYTIKGGPGFSFSTLIVSTGNFLFPVETESSYGGLYNDNADFTRDIIPVNSDRFIFNRTFGGTDADGNYNRQPFNFGNNQARRFNLPHEVGRLEAWY